MSATHKPKASSSVALHVHQDWRGNGQTSRKLINGSRDGQGATGETLCGNPMLGRPFLKSYEVEDWSPHVNERVNVEAAMREKGIGWILRELAGHRQTKGVSSFARLKSITSSSSAHLSRSRLEIKTTWSGGGRIIFLGPYSHKISAAISDFQRAGNFAPDCISLPQHPAVDS
ncbi:hypothetical protein ARMSODRAFT_1039535 [Armillaria solidipes]|uniref:Uncharacterized protein n=1 Tax=Armillaria solidipes TaxID=1076256 RepID=A0A2H3BRY9_9AGAR|nr:hypothetical protein ARMSODRAFT_1039535 [Armillaria solidipes]